ncbi:hypothetical protein Nepgr_030242 [Nepenthes gracilis]|uniref:S-adenosyl-L-methionine-dependent methyltransferase superfamily protein n=1 Tax=Nepenthes gracilis TaxID=150966 RepID=A0AAD3TFZ1_NEPGR|nr:hypothetical protein Nepgr_030242 [Nepenthes gracilis]
MWLCRRTSLSSTLTFRWMSTAIRHRIVDEGDWSYASEWWGDDTDVHTHTVLRAASDKGNGVVSVLAYPSSRPAAIHWPTTERWLQQRYSEVFPDSNCNEKFSVLGYQWRVLRFNDDTRQSTVKIMAASKISDPGSVFFMQQSHCLAVPYLKSMASAGLTSLASCNYDLLNVVRGTKTMHVLCIGHGGGSLPLFIASTIKGAVVDIVEIDPLVISASIKAMGFPSFSVAMPSGQHILSRPGMTDKVLWRGIHERLFLYESDAEQFVLKKPASPYDLVFIDAYDGDDVFPRKMWDPHSPFLEVLSSVLHPEHGTVVVNLHSDVEVWNSEGSVSPFLQPVLPMGKYISRVCSAYKDVLLSNRSSSLKVRRGLAFAVSVPWVCNATLVICRGFSMNGRMNDGDLILNTLVSKSIEVGNELGLPFSCFPYVKRDFVLID